MKQIPLTQDRVALVSDRDYKHLMQWNWYTHRKAKTATRYAARSLRSLPLNDKMRFMHNLVARRMGFPAHQRMDHADGNGLNNQRCNLRPATRSQNGANRGKQSNNSSGYKGVYRSKVGRKWGVQIKIKQKNKWLGRYDTKIEAARAYNKAALEYFGKYAVLNKV